MIGLEITIFVSGLFCIYEALTYLGIWGMPYISLISNLNIYFTVVKVCVLKWALILGIVGVVFSITSFILFRNNPDYMKYRLFVTGFYLLVSLLMLF